MVQKIIFLIFLIFSHLSLAKQKPVFLKLKIEVQNTENLKQKTTLNILRLKRIEGTPVILSHAFALSYHSLLGLAISLWEKGYDVWLPNMRGHGNGEEKSVNNFYTPGSYSFESIVTQDWPYLLNYIYKKTNKKILIVGHSVGGMTWEQCLCGVYRENKKIKQSDEIAKLRAKKVLGFVGLAVPQNFDMLSHFIKTSLQPLYFLLPSGNYFIPLSLDTYKKDTLEHLYFYLKKTLIFISKPGLKFFLSKEILNYDNIEDSYEEFNQMLDNDVSSPHSDLLQDFFRWIYKSGYKSLNGEIDYSTNKKLFTPSLLYACSLDKLVPFETIESANEQYPDNYNRKLILLNKFSHIDIIFKKNIKSLSNKIIEFVHNIQNKSEVKLPFETINL